MQKILFILFLSLCLLSPVVSAADLKGFDGETGCLVDIDTPSESLYDYCTNDYHNISIESIDDREVEIYDYALDKYRTIELN